MHNFICIIVGKIHHCVTHKCILIPWNGGSVGHWVPAEATVIKFITLVCHIKF